MKRQHVKNIFRIISLAMMLVFLLGSFVSCGEEEIWVNVGHVYTEGTRHVVESTCHEDGYTTYVCEACGETYSVDRVEKDHRYVETSRTEPTCQDETITYTCRDCGDVKTELSTGTAVRPHTPVDEGVVIAPICQDGATKHTCADCGEVYYVDITEAVHDYGEDGKCTRCGEKYKSPAGSNSSVSTNGPYLAGSIISTPEYTISTIKPNYQESSSIFNMYFDAAYSTDGDIVRFTYDLSGATTNDTGGRCTESEAYQEYLSGTPVSFWEIANLLLALGAIAYAVLTFLGIIQVSGDKMKVMIQSVGFLAISFSLLCGSIVMRLFWEVSWIGSVVNVLSPLCLAFGIIAVIASNILFKEKA